MQFWVTSIVLEGCEVLPEMVISWLFAVLLASAARDGDKLVICRAVSKCCQRW